MALSRTTLISGKSAGGFGTGSFTTSSFTPPDNSLMLILVCGQANSGSTTSDGFSLSGGGLTFTRRLLITQNSNGWPTQGEFWTAEVTTGSSMTLTADHATANMGAWLVYAFAYTGYNTSSFIGATGSDTVFATDGADSFSLSGSPVAESDVVAFRQAQMGAAGGATATEGSGWTELFDDSVNDWASVQVQARTASTDSSVAWADTNAGGTTLDIVIAGAIEIKEAVAAGTNNLIFRPASFVPFLVR